MEKSKGVVDMLFCPICGGRTVGRIGRERYYCGECCHEWIEGKETLKVYRILSDGTVSCLKSAGKDRAQLIKSTEQLRAG